MVISYIDDQTLKACIGGLALFMGVRYWYRVYKPSIGKAAAHVKKAMRTGFVNGQQFGVPRPAFPALFP